MPRCRRWTWPGTPPVLQLPLVTRSKNATNIFDLPVPNTLVTLRLYTYVSTQRGRYVAMLVKLLGGLYCASIRCSHYELNAEEQPPSSSWKLERARSCLWGRTSSKRMLQKYIDRLYAQFYDFGTELCFCTFHAVLARHPYTYVMLLLVRVEYRTVDKRSAASSSGISLLLRSYCVHASSTAILLRPIFLKKNRSRHTCGHTVPFPRPPCRKHYRIFNICSPLLMLIRRCRQQAIAAKAELRRCIEQEEKNSKINRLKIQNQWRKIMRLAKVTAYTQ